MGDQHRRAKPRGDRCGSATDIVKEGSDCERGLAERLNTMVDHTLNVKLRRDKLEEFGPFKGTGRSLCR
jgi:hypothetical protein